VLEIVVLQDVHSRGLFFMLYASFPPIFHAFDLLCSNTRTCNWIPVIEYSEIKGWIQLQAMQTTNKYNAKQN
jgi:hypothetical protein